MKLELLLLVFGVSSIYAFKREECVFPFRYKGELYHDCVDKDTASPWCSAKKEYDGSYFYCNEEQAQSVSADGHFLKAQQKLIDNTNALKELEKSTGSISECDKCDASMHAAVGAMKSLRKIADDNERRIAWYNEKEIKDSNNFITSLEEDLRELTDCPSGFIEFNDHCYSFAVVQKWQEGNSYCEKVGAKMASIHSAAENDFIFNQIMSRYGRARNVYLGLNDIKNEGKFEWTDGTEVDYLNWNRGEPNGLPGENCAEMLTQHNAKVWNDISCSHTHKNIICKKHILDI